MDTYLNRPLPQAKTVAPWTHVCVILLALLGGILGIGGSVISEVASGGGLALLPFIGAPIIEEAFKPIGVFLAFVRWPDALRNRLYVAILCACAGIVFGLVESTIYVFVYARDQGASYTLFRYTVPVAIHGIASFTVGLGMSRGVVEWVNRGAPVPPRARRFYLAGVTIHGTYNIVVTILYVVGVLQF
ncbi:MAG TPA: PrsW family glutamic-type intramembrane protease [Dehalococcoidia bacterium]|jgi:RsiW-degrading membrane proteinase PrsW (M82 family)|nr:PrsW family glutamic-type intramembrane protease [Dehalococcoidia bacterium]